MPSIKVNKGIRNTLDNGTISSNYQFPDMKKDFVQVAQIKNLTYAENLLYKKHKATRIQNNHLIFFANQEGIDYFWYQNYDVIFIYVHKDDMLRLKDSA